jgi:ATP-binding cassette subfamily B protein/subfamily B ATP-binding cassette protein MsbA
MHVFIYARALRYFRPYLWPSLGGVILTFAAIIVNSLKPWPFKYIVDGVLPSDSAHGTQEAQAFIAQWFGSAPPERVAFWLCVILVVVSLAGALISLAANYLFIRVGLKALLRLRTDLYTCLQSLPLKYHDARRSSDSSFRVAYDSQSIQTIYNKGFATILGSVVTLVWTFGIMVWMNWPLALTSLAVLPFVTWAIGYFADRVRRQSTTIQERESDLLALTQEGISQIRMVHAFGRESFEIRQFRKRAAQSLEASLRLNITSILSSLVVGTLMAAGTALMYYVGARQVLDGALTLGDLTVFATYLLMLYQPLEQLSYTAWAMEGAAAGAARCFEVLDREDDVPDAPNARPIAKARGDIEFRDVSFGYVQDRQILNSINLSIAAGESVAFVGGTGAGKSTLLSLVPRFYDPSSGDVLLDGRNLRDLTKKSLRLQIGMVLQDTILFSTTIKENIAYGRPGARDEQIIEAAQRAQAYDFITKMPQGFSSPVGERGSHLSVGQRQRIGIARAFLKDAPILLLDEPTSALDPGTEHAIMETIAELMRGRTTLIITHRLFTIHSIERIVVLEHGTIAEQGTGSELLTKGGPYAKLYQAGQYSR